MNIDSYEKSCRNSAKVSKINVSLEEEKNSSNVDFFEKYLRQKAKLHFSPDFLTLCVAGHMPSASPLGLPAKKLIM